LGGLGGRLAELREREEGVVVGTAGGGVPEKKADKHSKRFRSTKNRKRGRRKT